VLAAGGGGGGSGHEWRLRSTLGPFHNRELNPNIDPRLTTLDTHTRWLCVCQQQRRRRRIRVRREMRERGGEEGNEKKTLDDEDQKAAGRTPPPPPRHQAKNRHLRQKAKSGARSQAASMNRVRERRCAPDGGRRGAADLTPAAAAEVKVTRARGSQPRSRGNAVDAPCAGSARPLIHAHADSLSGVFLFTPTPMQITDLVISLFSEHFF
jgi:hypothetical protein